MTGFGNSERDNVSRLCISCKRPHLVGSDCFGNLQETVTAEAERLTQAARHHQYGPPHLDFAKVTGMAKALWGRGPETPVEHALYMILVKISRLENSYDRDSIVDICGYARTIEMIMERESGNVQQP